MNVGIINTPFKLYIYGFSGVVFKDYTGTAFKLSGKMWEIIKSKIIYNFPHPNFVFNKSWMPTKAVIVIEV